MVGKNEYEVVRTRTIPVPPARVHALVDDFHEWQRWSPWEDLDPDQRRTYSGPPSGVGAAYAWSGNRRAGEGRMRITEDDPTRVVVALDFVKPVRSSSVTTFELREADGGTEVTWRLVGRKSVATRVLGVFRSMDAMIGPDFEKGLDRLSSAARA